VTVSGAIAAISDGLRALIQSQNLDMLRKYPEDVISAKRMYAKLLELQSCTIEAMERGGPYHLAVHGMRAEFRFSLVGSNLRKAVESVLHVFKDDTSGFRAFAGGATEGLELRVKYVLTSDYVALIRKRFALAAHVHTDVFLGKRNSDPPCPEVYPVLADLMNTLGLNFGQG
jgi:hypothetical protein